MYVLPIAIIPSKIAGIGPNTNTNIEISAALFSLHNYFNDLTECYHVASVCAKLYTKQYEPNLSSINAIQSLVGINNKKL